MTPTDRPNATLLVYLKYPTPGAVKTRLARSIGDERAAACYREWIELILGRVQPLRPTTRVIGCFDGAPEVDFAPWSDLVDAWWQQPSGDLGIRLDAGFEAWRLDGGPVLAIGTDCPEIDHDLIQAGIAALSAADVVFGPAIDGGYYLVGTAKSLPGFFSDLPWSTPETLAIHLLRCQQDGWVATLLPVRQDIDTLEDLREYNGRK